MTTEAELAELRRKIARIREHAQYQAVAMVAGFGFMVSSWFGTVSEDLGNVAGAVGLGALIIWWIGRHDLRDLNARAMNLETILRYEHERAEKF